MTLKDDLIKLGNRNPDLRDHIRPVLDRISSSRRPSSVFDRWMSKRGDTYFSCDEFAIAYKEAHPEAHIKYGYVDYSDTTEYGDATDDHAWIYDPELDVTLDPTLEQFEVHHPRYQSNWWRGDDHPHAVEEGTCDSVQCLRQSM